MHPILNKYKNVGPYYLSPVQFKNLQKELKWNFSQVKIIHVAGTNGKGSTCHFLNNVLSTNNSVGMFISPHVVQENERIQINGVPIPIEKINFIINEYTAIIDRYMLNFFEIYLLVAIVYFLELKVNIIILEAGIGGKFDSTNFLKSEYACITSIGNDHQEMLGSSLFQIAYQKSGIFKYFNKSIYFCEEKKQIANFLYLLAFLKTKFAHNIYYETKLISIDHISKKIHFSNRHGIWVINSLATYQIYNASIAIEILISMNLSKEIIQKNINKKIIPKSLESWKHNTQKIYLDGAHNIPGMQKLIESLHTLNWDPKKTAIIFNASLGKHPNKLLKIINDAGYKNVYIYESQFDQNVLLPKNLNNNLYLESSNNWRNIYNKIYLNFNQILFTGSIYFIGKVKQEFGKELK